MASAVTGMTNVLGEVVSMLDDELDALKISQATLKSSLATMAIQQAQMAEELARRRAVLLLRRASTLAEAAAVWKVRGDQAIGCRTLAQLEKDNNNKAAEARATLVKWADPEGTANPALVFEAFFSNRPEGDTAAYPIVTDMTVSTLLRICKQVAPSCPDVYWLTVRAFESMLKEHGGVLPLPSEARKLQWLGGVTTVAALADLGELPTLDAGEEQRFHDTPIEDLRFE